MDAGGYNIENIGSLELTDNVDLGAECDQKYIGTTVTGMLVSCVGASVNNSENTEKKGKWRIPNELPVGAVYISLTEDDPSESLGYGTWESFGAGQVMVGQKSNISDDDKSCIPGENNEADCWQYILGGTNQGNTTNTTENAELALGQMPDHRHWWEITAPKLEEKCEPNLPCNVESELASKPIPSDQLRSSSKQRTKSTDKLTPLQMAFKLALEQYSAQLAAATTSLERAQIVANFVKITTAHVRAYFRRPYRNIDDDAEFSEGHQHKINQPSIVVKMWQRIEPNEAMSPVAG